MKQKILIITILLAVLYMANKLFKKQIVKMEGLIFPLSIKTYVTSKFGNRKDPKGNKTQFHNGIDLHAPIGTKIFSPLDGVAFIADNAQGGKQLVISHDNGFKTGYAHLSEHKVRSGERVKAGQLVALSGNSGAHTTAAHLHLTVTNDKGVKIDPLTFFKLPTT